MFYLVIFFHMVLFLYITGMIIFYLKSRSQKKQRKETVQGLITKMNDMKKWADNEALH